MSASFARMSSELGAAVSGGGSGLSAADELCTACVDVLGVEGAAISLIVGGASRGTYGSSSEGSRRLDEYQFTFGQGPCLDAAAAGAVIHAPDLVDGEETRWPVLRDALLGEGIGAVFALPVRVASAYVGALDLYRRLPGPLAGDELAGGLLAAELASVPLLSVINDLLNDRGVDGSGERADTEEGEGSPPLFEMDRVEVYQATGMLIAQLDVDASEALARLRAHAIASGQTASEVAWAILERRLELERDAPHHESKEG